MKSHVIRTFAITLFAVLFLFGSNALAEVTAVTGQAEIKISGDLETNTDFESKSEDTADGETVDTTSLGQCGRVKIVTEGKSQAAEGGFFMAAKAEVLGNLDGTVTMDDSWGQIGNSSINLKVGRYELEEMVVKGEDVFIIEPPIAQGRYELNDTRGRTANQLGLSFTSLENLTFELGAQYGDSDMEDNDGNVMAVRPVVVFETGALKVKLGAEYGSYTPDDNDADWDQTTVGFGAHVGLTFGSTNLGVSVAHNTLSGTTEVMDDAGNVTGTADLDDETTLTTFAILKQSLGDDGRLIGLGIGYTTFEIDNEADYKEDLMEGYIAYVHPLPVENAFVKFAISYASVTAEQNDVDDLEGSGLGGRVRFVYTF